MIYQVEIGDHANAYIITGGITGLTEFEPTIILGDDTGVRINIDSKDDDIFTPWIKQSLDFTVVKETEGQYDDILAGNDNETFGVLIENGYLSLSGSDIVISNGGILKFIGTLALESYTEQYKQTSIVQFTFHDRIGTMDDDLFYTNTQFKNVADVLACCINKVSCSDRLKLEWPYTTSSSNDPTEILIDIENFDGKKRIEVLEKILQDFGLQMVIDFEQTSGSDLLSLRGSVQIRSIIEHVNNLNTHWELALSSFVSSVCGREYFTYTGSEGNEINRLRQVLNTNTLPLIDADSSLSLERVASEIKAINNITLNNSTIFRSKFNFKYTYSSGTGRNLNYYYCPFAELSSTEATCLDAIENLLNFITTVGDYDNPKCYDKGVLIARTWFDGSPPVSYYYPVTHSPIVLNKDQFNVDGELEFNAKVTAFNANVNYTNILRINPVILQKSTGIFKIYYSGAWHTLTAFSQLISYNEYTISEDQEETNTRTFTIDNEDDDVILMIVLTSGYGEQASSLLVSNIELTAKEETANIPDSITLTTLLTGNNRKTIDVDSSIMNCPDIIGSCYSIGYLIKDINNKYPLTLTYKALDQTLLAHLSDQYAWQFDGNRWNLDGSAKVANYANTINLMGQFGLDEKILMFISGDYDAKRRILKGKWGQVLEVGDEVYRLEKDNFDHFTWDNSSYIMLN